MLAISYDKKKKGEFFWYCKCNCGNENVLSVSETALHSGLKKTCGHAEDIKVSSDKICEELSRNTKFISLAEKYPELAKEWNTVRNGKLSPENVAFGSAQTVWWILHYDDEVTGKHFDFEWQATIASRIAGAGCPYLSNRKIYQGYNDFGTWCKINDNMYLLQEWNYEKNELQPFELTIGSDKLIWWICKDCGYEYQLSPYRKNRNQISCRICQKRMNAHKRKVINLDTGEIFDSLQDAANSIGISYTNISMACRKGTKARGYRWAYYEG